MRQSSRLNVFTVLAEFDWRAVAQCALLVSTAIASGCNGHATAPSPVAPVATTPPAQTGELVSRLEAASFSMVELCVRQPDWDFASNQSVTRWEWWYATRIDAVEVSGHAGAVVGWISAAIPSVMAVETPATVGPFAAGQRRALVERCGTYGDLCLQSPVRLPPGTPAMARVEYRDATGRVREFVSTGVVVRPEGPPDYGEELSHCETR